MILIKTHGTETTAENLKVKTNTGYRVGFLFARALEGFTFISVCENQTYLKPILLYYDSN